MLADPPFGPWTLNAAGAPAAPGPLDGTPLQLDADLYLAVARAGLSISPADLDRCEAWQVAALLGLHRPEETADGTGRPVRSNRDLIAERMRHARGEGPKPEPDAPHPSVAVLMQQVGGSTEGV